MVTQSPLLRWRRREEAGRRERAALVASESVQIQRPRTRRQAETAQDFGFVSDAKTRSTATNNARPVADEAEHAVCHAIVASTTPPSQPQYRCRRARICPRNRVSTYCACMLTASVGGLHCFVHPCISASGLYSRPSSSVNKPPGATVVVAVDGEIAVSIAGPNA